MPILLRAKETAIVTCYCGLKGIDDWRKRRHSAFSVELFRVLPKVWLSYFRDM
ncbi:uncharacterized protein PHALS_11494 [Plasmopara halstedii]|uniref:Uncharacterized protein n=1 Tax=Plasmopara halstedii TaxID=4781 RepID=A0A0P1A545_PLAHL|nr:uncharacterized protein PHALS_11494 [Plasmopara halstedii]CEG35623.1 hypothetical protein PHALS_11494 [Plasmopara halstedii]|eukprot:XP_024571992.1 hypothetical protein PHALS_11494 [Plasmopara halstedii]